MLPICFKNRYGDVNRIALFRCGSINPGDTSAVKILLRSAAFRNHPQQCDTSTQKCDTKHPLP
jgi:hypothetical protein